MMNGNGEQRLNPINQNLADLYPGLEDPIGDTILGKERQSRPRTIPPPQPLMQVLESLPEPEETINISNPKNTNSVKVVSLRIELDIVLNLKVNS